ncbi:MAG: L,D-transpeptidase family protein [Nitrospirota bacterium]
MHIITVLLFILLIITSNTNASGVFPLDDPARIIVGANKIHIIKDKESLVELAREYGVGYNELIAANRDVDPWVPEEGTKIVIPTSWLLPEINDKRIVASSRKLKGYNLSGMLFPETRDNGIVINLAELRLYYFFNIGNKGYVRTFPLGIGRAGWNTPSGVYRITAKVKDPVWKVPDSIKEEKPELPDFVLQGPENPLGSYWLQLSAKGYGIHGTNRPYGIGRRVSHGCIRLYPEDIKALFNLVKVRTKVRIINEPVKTGIFNRKVFLEVHRSEENSTELVSHIMKKLDRKHMLNNIDKDSLVQAIKNSTGLPVLISK